MPAASPTSRGSRWVPPPPGMIPSRISGQPISAGPSLMTRKSHASASSQPPPSACPAISAITGFGRRCTRPNVPCARSTRPAVASAEKCSSGKASSRAPAMKIFSFALASTTTRIAVVALEQVEQDGEIVVEIGVECVRRRLVQHAARDRAVALDGEETGLGEIGIQTRVW